MSQTSASVTMRGSHSAFRPAERVTVHATGSLEGPDAERAYAPQLDARLVTGG